MKYLQYAIASIIRKLKKSRARFEYLDFYSKKIEMNKPTICLTHDIDEGYEPNLDRILDLERKYGVNSTMFLINTSHPSKKWIKRNRDIDFQFHADFIRTKDFIGDKKDIDNLIGKRTTIIRAHQYYLPSMKKIAPYFKADSTYNNWLDLTLFNPFLTNLGIIEFPAFPEIPFQNMKKYENVVKVWKNIFLTARKVDGLAVTLTHPTLFKSFGSKLEEFFITQKGFEIKTLSDILKKIKK